MRKNKQDFYKKERAGGRVEGIKCENNQIGRNSKKKKNEKFYISYIL